MPPCEFDVGRISAVSALILIPQGGSRVKFLVCLLLVPTLATLACSQITGTLSSSSECLVAKDIAYLRADWNADREATESKYVGETLCVEGEISFVKDLPHSIVIGAGAEEAAMAIVAYKDEVPPDMDKAEENRKTRELAEWLEGKGEGDIIRAECLVEGFATSMLDPSPVGTVDFEFCEFVK